MTFLITGIFILGYTLIALEHPLKLDKAATALLTGVFCWLALRFGMDSMPAFQGAALGQDAAMLQLNQALSAHLSSIAEILFFLLAAMTIVELVDVHQGFRVITDRITTTNRLRLLWILSWVTFFLSAVLDNMTTAIILCALIRQITQKKEDRCLFGGFVIIAANAGGAFSPIGDVTTIMLWIGGQISTLPVIKSLFWVSVANLLAPLLLASWFMRGKSAPEDALEPIPKKEGLVTPFEQNLVFVLGSAALLSVPVFKQFTHFPPYMGILLSVALLWHVTEFLHRGKTEQNRKTFSVAAILQRVDTPSILFFLGILLAVAALDTSGHLHLAATGLDALFGGNIVAINSLIGLLSAIVDNVPLVAAAMGMYKLNQYPADHDFWNLLAYCAGTGGSILIIGSAAGVATMGLLKIDFLWYLKRISLYALVGYLAGIGTYLLCH